MRIFALAATTVILSAPAWAQSTVRLQNLPEPPSMTSSATTLAPIAPGSRIMHEVPTPAVAKRSNTIGMGEKLTGSGN